MHTHNHTINTLEVVRNLTLENDGEKLSGREFHALICIVMRRNNTTFQCNPSIKRVALDMNCARSTAQDAISSLERKGYIRITKRRNEDTGVMNSSQYWIMRDIDKIHEAMKDEEARDWVINYAYVDVVAEYDFEFGTNYTETG